MSYFLKLALKFKIPKLKSSFLNKNKTFKLPNYLAQAKNNIKSLKKINPIKINKSKTFGIKNPSVRSVIKTSDYDAPENPNLNNNKRTGLYAATGAGIGALGGGIAGEASLASDHFLAREMSKFLKGNAKANAKASRTIVNKLQGGLKGQTKYVNRKALLGGALGTMGGLLFSHMTKNRKPTDIKAKLIRNNSPYENSINRSIRNRV